MATPRGQQPNKAEEVRQNSPSSNSVPDLRQEVEKLAEAVIENKIKIEKLERQNAN